METKVNYTIVGIFVLVLGVIFIAGILWLSSGKFSRQKTDTYLAYMRESVSGLNLNAAVKFRGVQVGQVTEIVLDPQNSEQVKLVLKVAHDTPIKEDTEAVLKTQGLTGIAYVELMGGSQNSPLLKKKKSDEHPIIKTKPSLTARLDTALSEVVGKLNLAADNINSVLDEQNRKAFKDTLRDISHVSKMLASRAETMDRGIRDAAITMENSARISSELVPMIERVNQAATSVKNAADRISETGTNATRVLNGIGNDVSYFTNQTQPELENLITDLRQLSVSIRRTSEQLEHNPSMLLFGKPVTPGPGE